MPPIQEKRLLLRQIAVKCLILASGFGTRLYPLTRDKAKALSEYEGKPLLTNILEKIRHNIDILVTANRKLEMDFSRWREGIDRKVEIGVEDVWPEEQALGAVGSLNLWVNRKAFSQDLLVIAYRYC